MTRGTAGKGPAIHSQPRGAGFRHSRCHEVNQPGTPHMWIWSSCDVCQPKSLMSVRLRLHSLSPDTYLKKKSNYENGIFNNSMFTWGCDYPLRALDCTQHFKGVHAKGLVHKDRYSNKRRDSWATVSSPGPQKTRTESSKPCIPMFKTSPEPLQEYPGSSAMGVISHSTCGCWPLGGHMTPCCCMSSSGRKEGMSTVSHTHEFRSGQNSIATNHRTNSFPMASVQLQWLQAHNVPFYR